MRAISVLTILLVTVIILFVGSILYGSPGFVAWGAGVVALGAGMQILLHRREVTLRESPGRRSTDPFSSVRADVDHSMIAIETFGG